MTLTTGIGCSLCSTATTRWVINVYSGRLMLFYCLSWYVLAYELFTAAWVCIRHILQVLPIINRAQIIDDTFNLARYTEQKRCFQLMCAFFLFFFFFFQEPHRALNLIWSFAQAYYTEWHDEHIMDCVLAAGTWSGFSHLCLHVMTCCSFYCHTLSD